MSDPMNFLGNFRLQPTVSSRLADEVAEAMAARAAEEAERHERAEQRETELLEQNVALTQRFSDFVTKVERDRADDQQRLERAEQRELEALALAKDSRRVAWIALLVAIVAIVVPLVWPSNQTSAPGVTPSVSVPTPASSPTPSEEVGRLSGSPSPSAS
ncbi:hypothetical protein [Micromonospora sp. NPDC007230]|uniref:hypothetical protein n=1 Tax=Micromonospora sp. NPDC007230 TaxID=3364237 RepID=UPI0036A88EB1